MIKMTFEAETFDGLVKAMCEAILAVANITGTPEESKPQDYEATLEKPKRGRKKKATPAVQSEDGTTSAAEVPPVVATESAAPAAGEAQPEIGAKASAEPAPADPTLDDVRLALNNLLNAKGMQAVTNLLTRHGVNRVSALQPKDYAAVIKACA